jgi:hypothetical protein
VPELGPVAHAYNPSYSGGRDQEDHGSNLAQAYSSQDPTLKKPITQKRAGGSAPGVGPEFKPAYYKKKEKKKTGEGVPEDSFLRICGL